MNAPQLKRVPETIEEAEEIAGVKTRAIRDQQSRIFDIDILSVSSKSFEPILGKLKQRTGAKTLFINEDTPYDTLAIMFEEVYLVPTIVGLLVGMEDELYALGVSDFNARRKHRSQN